eukprot:1189881-Prorocentrum_minimum.AAC.6
MMRAEKETVVYVMYALRVGLNQSVCECRATNEVFDYFTVTDEDGNQLDEIPDSNLVDTGFYPRRYLIPPSYEPDSTLV